MAIEGYVTEVSPICTVHEVCCICNLYSYLLCWLFQLNHFLSPFNKKINKIKIIITYILLYKTYKIYLLYFFYLMLKK